MAEAMLGVWKAAAEYAARFADEKQAKIDALMLEFCQEEMTEAQKENWAKHQRPVSDDVQLEIDSALMGSNVQAQRPEGCLQPEGRAGAAGYASPDE